MVYTVHTTVAAFCSCHAVLTAVATTYRLRGLHLRDVAVAHHYALRYVTAVACRFPVTFAVARYTPPGYTPAVRSAVIYPDYGYLHGSHVLDLTGCCLRYTQFYVTVYGYVHLCAADYWLVV